MTDFTLGYWGIRGKGQVPRLLLAYSGAKWTDKKYTAPEQWFGGDKQSLGLSFPNLPYVIHGDFKLTESSAVVRYIARATGHSELLGKNIHDQAIIDQFLGVVDDVATATIQLCFNPDFEHQKETVFKSKIEAKLNQLDNFIGDLSNKEWTLGYLTIADFKIAEAAHYLEGIWPEEYKKHSKVHEIRTRFENLEQIKAYYASENAVKGPFLPPSAKWH